jgi:hypothetical protein
MSIFWIVIAVFYLSLAIVTYVTGKPVLRSLTLLSDPGDSIVSYLPGKGEVGLESTVLRAFKAIVITDMAGFILAAMAAAISIISG